MWVVRIRKHLVTLVIRATSVVWLVCRIRVVMCTYSIKCLATEGLREACVPEGLGECGRVPGRSPQGVLTRVITRFLPTFPIWKILPWVITSFNPD
jgi:hypothetical protein